MDVLDVVKADHNRVESWLEQIKDEMGKQQRRLLFKNIAKELELHAYAEENVFYATLKKYPSMASLLKDSLENHQEIRKLIQEIDQLQDQEVEFQNKILELKNHVEAHVSLEESEIFVFVKHEIKAPDRERLGRLFLAIKREYQESAA
jgi:hemerythrin superfamily protein